MGSGRLRKPLLFGLGLAAVVGSSAFAYVQLRPEPPVVPAVEQKYEDIARSDYEKWMQDLGYYD
ncbi:MAG: hypothetical protein Q8P41_19700 [Pseudomonadota bacterium]|nr:hypothetical protein [Pseudomonadota bacterium]